MKNLANYKEPRPAHLVAMDNLNTKGIVRVAIKDASLKTINNLMDQVYQKTASYQVLDGGIIEFKSVN